MTPILDTVPPLVSLSDLIIAESNHASVLLRPTRLISFAEPGPYRHVRPVGGRSVRGVARAFVYHATMGSEVAAISPEREVSGEEPDQ
jgi:hypothetical protein